MIYLDEITKYKEMMFKFLWNSESVKELISDKNMPYDYFLDHVFPYGKNPNTVTEEGTYIFFDVDPRATGKKEVVRYTLFFWIISHDLVNRIPTGIRVDMLTREIEKIFLNSRMFGIGELEYGGAPTFNSPTGFYGRNLTYHTTDFHGVLE